MAGGRLEIIVIDVDSNKDFQKQDSFLVELPTDDFSLDRYPKVCKSPPSIYHQRQIALFSLGCLLFGRRLAVAVNSTSVKARNQTCHMCWKEDNIMISAANDNDTNKDNMQKVLVEPCVGTNQHYG